MIAGTHRQRALWLLLMVALPVAVYLAIFAILTYPRVLQLSTHLFADSGDGFQNYWNIWWINKAVTELHKPFWHTPYIHYPYGTTLLGHTLNPFNGLISIPFLTFLSLVQVHNLVVVFSFVASGLTAFFLAYYLTQSYWPSLIGGAIFTFSNYHFAHAEGHLQLVSMEWLPLFALSWRVLLDKPRPLVGVLAALALFLVALCDYYYLFYSVLLACLMLAWQAYRHRDLFFFASRQHLLSLAAFAAAALATSGPIALSVILLNATDPLVGAHPTKEVSLDLLGPLIPGGHWRFAELSQAYWSRLTINIHEGSVHLGLSVIILMAFVGIRRRSVPSFDAGVWYLVVFFFLALGLGPVLHVAGTEIPIPLPYALLEAIFPPLAMSGVPIRMMVMVTLAGSVLSAMGLKMLLSGPRPRWGIAALLLALLIFEYLPSPIPAQQVEVPGYVYVLKGLEDDGKGVLDTTAGGTRILYHQTIHEKPIAYGFIARITTSVANIDYQLSEVTKMGDYDKLRREFGIRYFVADVSRDVLGVQPSATILWQDEKVKLYDLGP